MSTSSAILPLEVIATEGGARGKLTEFYERIEPGVRDIVRMLRDNGINTTSSCEHEGYIQFECVGLAYEVKVIHDLLFNAGLRGYSIETKFGQPPDGFGYHRGTIRLTEWR